MRPVAAALAAGLAAAAPGAQQQLFGRHARGPAVRSVAHPSVPFLGGIDGYAAYRIPALVRDPSIGGEGTLLAFAEGRLGGTGDGGKIDLVEYCVPQEHEGCNPDVKHYSLT